MLGQDTATQIQVQEVVDAVKRGTREVAHDQQLVALAEQDVAVRSDRLQVGRHILERSSGGLAQDDFVRCRRRVIRDGGEISPGHLPKEVAQLLGRGLLCLRSILPAADDVPSLSGGSQRQVEASETGTPE